MAQHGQASSLDFHRPAARRFAVLDVSQCLMQTHRQRSVVHHRRDLELCAVVENSLDRADDARGAGAEEFQQSILVQSSEYVAHEDRPFDHVELIPAGGQLHEALPRDAGQDEPGRERRGHELAVSLLVDPERKEVHRANLGNFVVRPVQPQHLHTSYDTIRYDSIFTRASKPAASQLNLEHKPEKNSNRRKVL